MENPHECYEDYAGLQGPAQTRGAVSRSDEVEGFSKASTSEDAVHGLINFMPITETICLAWFRVLSRQDGRGRAARGGVGGGLAGGGGPFPLSFLLSFLAVLPLAFVFSFPFVCLDGWFATTTSWKTISVLEAHIERPALCKHAAAILKVEGLCMCVFVFLGFARARWRFDL